MSYRHLPHIDIAGHYQFITFRTNDSADTFLKKIAAHNKPDNQKQQDADNYLDSSIKGAYLNNAVLIALSDFLMSKDSLWYELVAFSIMPNHVHLLIKPNDKLALVMQKIKGGSSKIINTLMKRNGTFWASDYYDKLVRDEQHFSVIYQYIKNNPLKLAEKNERRFYGIYDL